MSDLDNKPWYHGITRYQWLVLIVACLGWVFDVFEGQIFIASMKDAMPSLLGVAPDDGSVLKWNNLALASFLLGGAFGGVLFGVLSDRIGRTKTMMLTILFYSAFTCLSAFSQQPWHMVVLRFFVAMGVGGEWAVASAMVAEVMPKRARPITSSIFHASSVFGTLLAIAAGRYLIGNEAVNAFFEAKGIEAWRLGFGIGALPALLIIWIRWKLKEPDSWKAARERAQTDPSQKQGQLHELFAKPQVRSTFIGVTLAAVGLVTFWGIHIYGKNALMRSTQAQVLKIENVASDAGKLLKDEAFEKHKYEIKKSEMLSMTLNTVGGGMGLILFGAISNRLGRKGAFVMYHAVAFVMVIILFKILIPNPETSNLTYMIFLPVFGFFTLGMHAGYAVYFPELYPTRLRGTGAGFCFNMGRLGTAAAFLLFYNIEMRAEQQALWLSPLYLVGLVVVLFGKETRGEELPE